jgi:hypothetical protein
MSDSSSSGSFTVAVWNIEKNGQSSEDIKQEKVSEFVDFCCKNGIDLIFLCEVHSARLKDYSGFVGSVYSTFGYKVHAFSGGHSNAYILIVRSQANVQLSYDELKGLNRKIVLALINGVYVCLAHFKSGQTGLTKDQLQQAADSLDGLAQSRWLITGDMNWDFSKAHELKLPGGAHAATCWKDQTQAKGGILDWCLAGGLVAVEPMGESLFSATMADMQGPDHRPVVFAAKGL